MTSNHHVMEADALARSLEFRPELTAMVGSAFHKWEHLQPPAELLVCCGRAHDLIGFAPRFSDIDTIVAKAWHPRRRDTCGDR
jgi:hypothetical protein